MSSTLSPISEFSPFLRLNREFPGGLVVRIPSLSLPWPRVSPWSVNWDPSSHMVQPKKKTQYCSILCIDHISLFYSSISGHLAASIWGLSQIMQLWTCLYISHLVFKSSVRGIIYTQWFDPFYMCSLISLTRYRTCPSPQEVPCPFLLSIPLPTPRQSLIYFLSLEISFAFSRIYLMERYKKSSFESSFLCAQLSVFQIHLCCHTPVLFCLLQNSLYHWMDKPHWFIHSTAVGHWVLSRVGHLWTKLLYFQISLWKRCMPPLLLGENQGVDVQWSVWSIYDWLYKKWSNFFRAVASHAFSSAPYETSKCSTPRALR